MPKAIRLIDRSSRNPLRRLLVSFLLLLALLTFGYFLGFWDEYLPESLSRILNREDLTSLSSQQINQNAELTTGITSSSTYTPTIVITATPTMTATITPTLTPTRTPTPTDTGSPTGTQTDILSPTITLTPTCLYQITYNGISYYANNLVQISYTTPVDLSPFLMIDSLGKITQQLDLPGFRLLKNGRIIYDYEIYQRDPAHPDWLFLEVQAGRDDEFELEFFVDSTRYCSLSYMVPGQPATSTSTPIPTSTRPGASTPTRTIAPTRTPTPTRTLAPTKTPTTPVPPTPKPTTPVPPTPTPTNTLPTINITSPADIRFDIGQRVTFSAIATDVEDGNISDDIIWTWNGNTRYGASFTYQFESEGFYTITASVTDSGGGPASDKITIEIYRSTLPPPTP